MARIRLQKTQNIKECTIELPSSKSIANRVLIIQHLSQEAFIIKNLSSAHDTKLLQNALLSAADHINIEDAGTAARFMCAYLAVQKGQHILNGSKRMQQRPMEPLVQALQSMGANIKYLGEKGFLPLQFETSVLQGRSVAINSSSSSQFISALLLIAPLVKNGISITYDKLVSSDYVEMTLELMKYFGIESEWTEGCIRIEQQTYKAQNISIESDWSSASYFFSIAALIPESRIQLNKLSVYSLQGDRVCSNIATLFGAETHLLGDNIAVRNEPTVIKNFEFDFSHCPDLVMTFAVLCAIKNTKAILHGIEHLAYKESNRLLALQSELAKINCRFYAMDDVWHLEPSGFDSSKSYEIHSHNDHRIAMAFAPLALVCKSVVIDNDQVVNKSFPNFWKELEKCGLTFSVC